MSTPVELGKERKRMMLSILASVLLPPLGLYLAQSARWSKRQKWCLSALSAVCLVAIACGLFWPDNAGDGGVEYVMRKPEAQIYGPEMPVANVNHYIAPVSQSVLVDDEDESITYVYATVNGECYHLSGCKYAYASAMKMTPYEAYYLGYGVCTLCNPPEYVPGTIY